VIGALQLDVLADRLQSEYGLATAFEQSSFEMVRWISADTRQALDAFVEKNRSAIAHDLDGAPVFMAQSGFMLNWTEERAPEIRFASRPRSASPA